MKEVKISLDVNSSSVERVANSYANKAMLTVLVVVGVVIVGVLFLYSAISSAYAENCGDMTVPECISSGVYGGLSDFAAPAASGLGAGILALVRGPSGWLSYLIKK